MPLDSNVGLPLMMTKGRMGDEEDSDRGDENQGRVKYARDEINDS